MKKGFANVILVGVVIILVAIAGYFVFRKPTPAGTLSPTKQNIEEQYSQERTAGTQTPAPKDTSNKNLVICDSKKESEIAESLYKSGPDEDTKSKNPVIVGFYTTREGNRDLKEIYKDPAQAEKYGWGAYYDFIEG